MNETKVRIDYVHHALSAVYQYILGARTDPNLPEGVRLSPAREAHEAIQAVRLERQSGPTAEDAQE
jgi:hypothetical protein